MWDVVAVVAALGWIAAAAAAAVVVAVAAVVVAAVVVLADDVEATVLTAVVEVAGADSLVDAAPAVSVSVDVVVLVLVDGVVIVVVGVVVVVVLVVAVVVVVVLAVEAAMVMAMKLATTTKKTMQVVVVAGEVVVQLAEVGRRQIGNYETLGAEHYGQPEANEKTKE